MPVPLKREPTPLNSIATPPRGIGVCPQNFPKIWKKGRHPLTRSVHGCSDGLGSVPKTWPKPVPLKRGQCRLIRWRLHLERLGSVPKFGKRGRHPLNLDRFRPLLPQIGVCPPKPGQKSVLDSGGKCAIRAKKTSEIVLVVVLVLECAITSS